MPKLPQVSGADVIKLLQHLGYQAIRQQGSHVRLEKIIPPGKHVITVPMHKVLAKGTLNDILNRVSLQNNIPKRELVDRLR